MKYIIVTTSIHSHTISQVQQMICAGANVLRYNAAYGSLAEISSHISNMRSWADSNNNSISIMIDIPGTKPRIIINNIEGIQVRAGDLIRISKATDHNDDNVIYLDNSLLIEDTKPEDVLLIDGGAIGLQVTTNNRGDVIAKALNTGVIMPNKGIWVKNQDKQVVFITTQGLEKYIEFIKKNKPEWIAISFATGTVMREANKLFKLRFCDDYQPKVAAKIETSMGVDTLDEITNYCDMLIVARGDLAQLSDYSKLGYFQEQIIRHGRVHKKPVIVATQILDSTVSNYLPSRAEMLDLYYIFKEKADGVMLADAVVRSKNPDYPVKIISEIERIYETR